MLGYISHSRRGAGRAINAAPVHGVSAALLEVGEGFLPLKGVDTMSSDEDDSVVIVNLLVSHFTSKLVLLEIEVDYM